MNQALFEIAPEQCLTALFGAQNSQRLFSYFDLTIHPCAHHEAIRAMR